MEKQIDTLKQLQAAAEELKTLIQPGHVVFLEGDLGAGKTTFTQNYLKACGVTEAVKSPTYNLYNQYQVGGQVYVHMDLYRLTDPEELYYLGIEDLLSEKNVILVEWPSKGRGVLPKADWILTFSLSKMGRNLIINSK